MRRNLKIAHDEIVLRQFLSVPLQKEGIAFEILYLHIENKQTQCTETMTINNEKQIHILYVIKNKNEERNKFYFFENSFIRNTVNEVSKYEFLSNKLYK